jgi:hypothetical protein
MHEHAKKAPLLDIVVNIEMPLGDVKMYAML